MASNQTENYGLNQWEPEDQVLREEFNADNAKIDGVLGQLGCAVGTYAGDGTSARLIGLGFRPKAVLIVRDGAVFSTSGSVKTVPEGGLAIDGADAMYVTTMIRVVDTGFQVWNNGVNESGKSYYYLAVKGL